ncbi:30S ribosomal protein S27 [Thermococcus siculi]|uniref:Small ribosomal subunit protein eS31 n=1 Tax=Thermococcus siculi TaxID=72803 RepID=A0A2Z2MX00_9EURY|nr:30S ribosomal protein S27ae [Thermococcus siculi]ASJ08430.1 30S ribosomal protein S27 [Thermococcus siculi]
MAKKRTSQKWKMYEVQGGKVRRKGKFCPRCGPGVFMAEHKDRWSCGRCGYTEWKRK